MSKKTFTLIALCSGVVAAAISLYLAYDVFAGRRAAVASAREEGLADTIDAAARIGDELRQIEAIANELAADIRAGRLGEAELAGRIDEILEVQPELTAIGVADVATGVEGERAEIGRREAGWSEPVWRDDLQVAEVTYRAPISDPAGSALDGASGEAGR